MEQIFEYIAQHYALFLGALILVLLAIIGYYAEKKYFLPGSSKKNDTTEEKKLDHLRFSDVVSKDNEKEDVINVQPEIEQRNDILAPIPISDEINRNDEERTTVNTFEEDLKENDEISTAEENFNKISEEIDNLLPEKEFINVDLLSDIAELELGKTQKIDLSSVPDLDDIDLPKIKKLVDDEQDIWKV